MSKKSFLYDNDGLVLPDFVSPERLQVLKSYKLYPDDVFVVTYPKCGTTWMMQVVKLIRCSGQQDDINLKFSVPWPEHEQHPIKPECIIQPRAFKSHMPYCRFPFGCPQELPCKFIYVARNPKDVVVSFYYHTRTHFFPDITKDAFYKRFVEGELEFGNYFEHIQGWWEHRDDKNVLFIRYEDMKKDLHHVVSQIATFIGSEITKEQATSIVEQTTFENMKKNPLAIPRGPEVASETDFMRKGIVGDWKNFLSPMQSAEIDDLCASKLSPVGLSFDFE